MAGTESLKVWKCTRQTDVCGDTDKTTKGTLMHQKITFPPTYPSAVVWQFNSSRRHRFPPTLARGRVPVGILPPVTHVLGLAKLLLITHTFTGLVVEPAGLEAG